mgnify:CR=1 FL=1
MKYLKLFENFEDLLGDQDNPSIELDKVLISDILKITPKSFIKITKENGGVFFKIKAVEKPTRTNTITYPMEFNDSTINGLFKEKFGVSFDKYELTGPLKDAIYEHQDIHFLKMYEFEEGILVFVLKKKSYYDGNNVCYYLKNGNIYEMDAEYYRSSSIFGKNNKELVELPGVLSKNHIIVYPKTDKQFKIERTMTLGEISKFLSK